MPSGQGQYDAQADTEQQRRERSRSRQHEFLAGKRREVNVKRGDTNRGCCYTNSEQETQASGGEHLASRSTHRSYLKELRCFLNVTADVQAYGTDQEPKQEWKSPSPGVQLCRR